MLLVAAVLASGIGLREVRKRVLAEGEARAAVLEARELSEQERWPEAISAVRRARGVLAAVWADASLRQDVEELHRDLEMAFRLQEAHLRAALSKDGHFDGAAAIAAYEEAFAWYGLDVTGSDPQRVAEFIQSRCIRVQLVAALDDWAANGKPGNEARSRLLATSRAADPDPWRRRFRDALEGTDSTAIEGLVASVPMDEQPRGTVHLLLNLIKGTPTAARLVGRLAKTQQRYPADFWINERLGICLAEMLPPRREEAIRYLAIAVALRPQSPGARLNLGSELLRKDQWEEAVVEFREALRLDKDYAEAHCNLGLGLRGQGKREEAIAEFREALRLKEDLFEAHCNLGVVLSDQGQREEAILEYRESLRIKKDSALVHYNLGNALADNGQLDDAIDAYRQAIHFKQDDAWAHCKLGNALHRKGKVDEAIPEYREAILLDKNNAEAHCNLGNVLFGKGNLHEAIRAYRESLRLKKDTVEVHCNLGAALAGIGQLDEAIPEFQEAIRLDKGHARAHNNLGEALRRKGQLDDAVAAFHQALRLKEDFVDAHANLGLTLYQEGQLDEAVAEYREALRLNKDLPRLSDYLAEALKMVRVRDRLATVLEGKTQPKDAGERIAFAEFCQLPFCQRYAAATRFYQEAFAASRNLAEERNGHRYNAACAAALAGCGRGKDAAGVVVQERARLRNQALDWLRAELDAWNGLLTKVPEKARPVLIQEMQHWLADPDFAGVRGSSALANLPAEERPAWQKLWADVDDLLARAQQKSTPAGKPDAK
jgi:tetratricopeptide (TPR) repeat protein